MHMKWLLVLTVSVMLLAGCDMIPFLDMPTFNDGEATAVVKSKVSEDARETQRNYLTLANAASPDDNWLAYHRLITALCFASYEGLSTPGVFIEETYLGDGVWLVERTSQYSHVVKSYSSRADVHLQKISLSWHVYETGNAVEFTGSFYYGATPDKRETPLDSCSRLN